MFSGLLISEEVVEGIKWNMSRSEVRKVLKSNNLGEPVNRKGLSHFTNFNTKS